MDTSKSERKKHKKSSKEKKSKKSTFSEIEIKVESNDSSDSEPNSGSALNINSDDEIFLVQCSKSVNVQKLVGAKFKFYDESVYIDSDIECKQESFKEKKYVTLLNGRSNGEKPFSFIPAGKIIIKEKIDFEPIDEVDNISPKKKPSVIPMPEILQIRHPLLGVDYKDKLQLDESVLEKLKEAANISIKKSPKRKLKKEKLVKMEVDEENEIVKVEKFKSPEKKKRSKIEKESETESESPTKKSKKIKKEKSGDVSMELDWISNL